MLLSFINYQINGSKIAISLPIALLLIVIGIIVILLIYWLGKVIHRHYLIHKYAKQIKNAKERLKDDYSKQLAMNQLNNAAINLEDLLDVRDYNYVVHKALKQTNYVHSHKAKTSAIHKLNQAELRRNKIRKRF